MENVEVCLIFSLFFLILNWFTFILFTATASSQHNLGDFCIPGTCTSLNSNCKRVGGSAFRCVCKEQYMSVNKTHCRMLFTFWLLFITAHCSSRYEFSSRDQCIDGLSLRCLQWPWRCLFRWKCWWSNGSMLLSSRKWTMSWKNNDDHRSHDTTLEKKVIIVGQEWLELHVILLFSACQLSHPSSQVDQSSRENYSWACMTSINSVSLRMVVQ